MLEEEGVPLPLQATTHSSSDERESGAWGESAGWGDGHAAAILTGRQRKKLAGNFIK